MRLTLLRVCERTIWDPMYIWAPWILGIGFVLKNREPGSCFFWPWPHMLEMLVIKWLKNLSANFCDIPWLLQKL